MPGSVECQLPVLAPTVFSALREQDKTNHSAMWDLLLHFLAKFPSAWDHVKATKPFSALWAALGSARYLQQCGSLAVASICVFFCSCNINDTPRRCCRAVCSTGFNHDN